MKEVFLDLYLGPSLSFVFLFWNVGLCTPLKASCPPGWFTSKTSRSCIKLFLSKKSWDNARKACQAQGADLLINYNKEKEKLIYEERDTLVREKFWIGLNDRNHEGDFTWLDDRQKITNVPWYRGEPNNYRNRQDCVLVNKKRNKEASLFDRECSYAIFFICEFSLENACDKITGSCISGCDEGYQGQRCDVQLCPPMWRASKTSRSCVKLFLSKKSWGDARKACQAHGADLLINYNQEKEKLIYEEKNTLLYIDCWIGLNDQNQEGDFNWLDNRQKIANVPWADGEPNNNRDVEDCATLRNQRRSGVVLFDQPCSFEKYFICELIPVCPKNTYGFECSKTCSENCGGPENACDSFTGFCTSGCDKGYQGERCEAACSKNTYGESCSKTCSENCGGPENVCDRFTGICTSGCDKGYQGERCEAACDTHKFGANCSENCSKQCGGPYNHCNNINGSCTFGCIDGYEGEKCENPCSKNTYGESCSKTCSENCGGPENVCDRFTGICTSGCDKGYQGERCEAACNTNKFGANCSENCSKQCGGPNNHCNNINGSCTFGCIDGYEGEKCENPCDTHKFGANCSENCNKQCGGPNNHCNNINGSCTFGCIDGYEGEKCETLMSTDNQNKGVPKIQILHVLATIAAVISLALIACLLAAMVYVGDTGLLEASRLTSDSEFTRSEKESAENQLQVQLLNSPDPLEVSDDNDSRLEQQGTQRRSLLEMILEHNDQTSYVSRELVLDND